jgi:hypothetical protein
LEKSKSGGARKKGDYHVGRVRENVTKTRVREKRREQTGDPDPTKQQKPPSTTSFDEAGIG